MPAFDKASFERAIARLPRWILLLAAAGTAIAGVFYGMAASGGYLLGSLGGYVNYRMIERAVNRVARIAGEPERKPAGTGTGIWVLIQFAGLILAAFVILRTSGFSVAAALTGFFVCPAAAVLEIVYELVTYEHS